MVVKQKFIVGISFLLFLFIFIPTMHAEAEEGQMYEVGTETLEMKTAPDQNAEVIGLLIKGDKLTIFQEKFGWVQTFYDGKEVWVASQYLIPINVETQKSKASKQDSNKKPKSASKTNAEVKKSSKEDNVVDSQRMIAGSLEITNNSLPAKQGDKASLSGYHIVIDPGHGGKDAGAIGIDDVYEKKLTLSTAKEVAEKLHDEGAAVTLTRSDDTFISLDDRVKISNKHKTNVFISLHYNAYNEPTVGGINTFYYHGEEEVQLAKSIQDSLINNVNMENRGAKQANYYVLRKNSNIAILVELGFITNPKDMETIQTKDYKKKVSEAIAEGLKKYFNK